MYLDTPIFAWKSSYTHGYMFMYWIFVQHILVIITTAQDETGVNQKERVET